ncbi:hypothetical protein [Sulfurimonas sp. C5]|uniref:hypothetical protein n=1 Tax=Sulfurimonas sp. C5 TaxID=3036947 RepID=UPI002456A601|nr:hypothetical protein [Sulfurimonas sp. C5]MDH4943708.1 hypothetical protein [Sulfurimonas sp. C5]
MQTLLKWLTPAIALGVAIFILFFLVSINSQEPIVNTKPLELKTGLFPSKEEKVWLNHFSESERKGYIYPVNEVYVKLDLDEKITKTITYKLSAKVKDPYQLFCLQEELKGRQLKYFLKKDRAGIDLLIYSQHVDKLNNLVKVLKNYKIQAQIELYKEEY